MIDLEIVVVVLAVGNIVTIFAAYTLGRNSGYRWGYTQGLKVADAWKAVVEKQEQADGK